MESLVNFLMGFSTALLPAMAFIAYYIHKTGLDTTRQLEKQIEQSQLEISAAQLEIEGLKKTVAQTQQNNIVLTELKESAEKRFRVADAGWKATQSTLQDHRQSAEAHDTYDFAGYVYVISEPELFGEGRFFIEATKDLDPQNLLQALTGVETKETFEVHMVLFHEQALWLQRQLHGALQGFKQSSGEFSMPLFSAEIESVREAMDRIHEEEDLRRDADRLPLESKEASSEDPEVASSVARSAA